MRPVLESIKSKKHGPFFVIIVMLSTLCAITFFMNPFIKTEAGETAVSFAEQKTTPTLEKKVVVNLRENTVTLSDGKTNPVVLSIISQGKPGSYYETIGGVYENDYKSELHFSSLGHVYMPYSVHVFGQYFIHGIPYFPTGEKVSSAYSGGCVRLADNDAKLVYDFVEYGTPIIMTQDNEESFSPTSRISESLHSSKMSLLMVAVLSLETLDQEVMVPDDNGEYMSRKELLPKLLSTGNNTLLRNYIAGFSEEKYASLMNQKAKAIGLSSTIFSDPFSPAVTTFADYVRFMNYISTYKTYLLGISEVSRF